MSLHLEPLDVPSPPSPGLRVEIVQPVSGGKLEALGASSTEVRVASNGLPEGAAVLIALDGQRPRRVPSSGKLTLADLNPPGVPLASGPHTLLAVAVDGSGRAFRETNGAEKPFAVTDFVVGEGTAPPASSPRLACLSPTGTHHGEDAARLILELYPVGSLPSDTVPVRVVAEQGGAELQLDPRRPYAVSGFVGGDVRFVAGGDGALRAECVTTLNPEVKRPEGP